MCSSVANGLPDRNRNCRQSLVAIITIPSLRYTYSEWRHHSGLVPSGIFTGFTSRATSNTCMHLEGATFHNKTRLETQEYDSNSRMHGIIIKIRVYIPDPPNHRP